MLGHFLADALDTMSQACGDLWATVVAYSDDTTETRTSYTGIVKDYDNQNVVFWDDVTVSRDDILEIGI